jgi:hypothetical protein
VIHGTVSMQSGAAVLTGVVVTLVREPQGTAIRTTTSDAAGRYRFGSLADGTYGVRAAVTGFQEAVRAGLTVAAGQDLEVDLQVVLAVSANVEATHVDADRPASATSGQVLSGSMIDIAPVQGDTYDSLLPLVPGVVRGPDGRINMKGGRPTQTGLQLNDAYLNDPSTGNAGITLPVDAVESVEVLAHPYAPEYGRFSAGVTKIETRKGGDAWHASATNFVPAPCLKICDGKNLGIRAFDPRVTFSGPLVPGRLFLSQSFQYHMHKERVPSLETGDDTEFQSLDSFTRIDVHLGAQQLTGTFALFPRNSDYVNLNTFTPQSAAPNFTQRGFNAAVAHTARLSAVSLVDSTVDVKQYDATVDPHGTAPMVIAPDGQAGNYFNQQDRRTATVQWIESFSTIISGAGEHVVKAGVDLLHARMNASSQSRSVLVRREDGSLSQQIDFSGPVAQRVTATDLGAFAQDGWRWNDRVLVELGARLDHDGVTDETHVSPRAGAVVAILPQSRSVVRGGAGRFCERTPLLVGAFETMERRTQTRYGELDDLPVQTTTFDNVVAGPLSTPCSRIWNVELDHRLTANAALRVNYLERSGRNEYIVDPIVADGAGALTLSSRGRSQYREMEVSFRYAARSQELSVSYVHSQSVADLNAFDLFFGNFRDPLIRPNQYGPTSVDVPHRLLVLSVINAGPWTVSPLVEARTGFPYSVVNDDQDYVGQRNVGTRFPVFASLDLAVSRAMVIRRRRVRLGFKANHILDNWTPRDVQANIASPAFGTFYNSMLRRLTLTAEIR